MDQENRRSFVKKSLATSMTFTFSGLIRAHGEEGGGTTTSDPWGTTVPASTGGGTTIGWATTVGTSTTAVVTTIPSKPKTRRYTLTLWYKGFDPQTSKPIYTKNKADAVAYSGAIPSIQLDGSPAANGDPGTLKAGGIPFGPGTGTSIQTNETHSSIDLDVSDPWDPDLVFSGNNDEPAPGGGKLFRYDVAAPYRWVYPSSP